MTVALSLFALIACGGIAFDYAHMAALHTELQQAADEAALAAATQLDGQKDACARAAAAAHDLVVNSAKFANGSGSLVVNIPNEGTCDATGSVQFYKAYDQTADTVTTNATIDADAKFVMVTVDSKYADYALTPITGLLGSGPMTASATATLGSGAICKVPPLMICNPNEASGGGFPASTDIGKGLKLEAGGGTAWAPGNYGYLDFGSGGATLEKAMGANTSVDGCLSTGSVRTKPGNTASTPAAINTRFDMYENGLTNYCDPATGNCSPAIDTIKDVIHPQFSAGTAPNELANASDNCGFGTGSDPWSLPTKQYLPDATTRAQSSAIGTPTGMGLPRDVCHAISGSGDCTNGRFGNGNWDRNLYFQVNYATSGTGWQSLSWLSGWATANSVAVSTITRYNVYRAELAAISAGTLKNTLAVDARRRFAETQSKGAGKGKGGGSTTDYYSYATARCAPAKGATTTIKDRRLLTAAVVNCTAGGVQGSSKIDPLGWVDLFVTEPSVDRGTLTGKDQIYVEVVGVATKPNGSNAFQYFLRQRPRLVK